jgi:predicted homoserine dehydrogenase-like protein
MIIIDKILDERHNENRPIRVGMIGAGFIGRGLALQFCTAARGMKLVAISNRNIEAARRAYLEAGMGEIASVESIGELEAAARAGKPAITEDPMLLCRAEGIDAVIEATGTVEFGAHVVLDAIEHRKHVVMMSAELDGTVGPILKAHADKANVVLTNADGDQPAVIMNLYRFLKGIGVRPILCGNIKGLQDRYRNPTTQEAYARQWKQRPHMVTSYADGTKISFEQAIVANATGMGIGERGMYGPTVPPGTPIEEAIDWYPLDEAAEGPGIVDYVIGASPSPGVFIIGENRHPAQREFLNLYKMGEGPYYCFHTAFHLCHFEVCNTVARAVLFQDAAITPLEGPVVEVVATAKTDLKAGQGLDGIGFYMTYGQCEAYNVARNLNLLPMGIAGGCHLKKDISKDQVLTYDDVELPAGRLCDRLRAEQDSYFASENARIPKKQSRVS